MKVLALGAAMMFLTGCTTILTQKDILFCASACAAVGGVTEVGKKSMTGNICCRCSDGTVIEQLESLSLNKQPAKSYYKY